MSKNNQFEIIYALFMGVGAGTVFAGMLMCFMYYEYHVLIICICGAVLVLLGVGFFFVVRSMLKQVPKRMRYCVKKDYDKMTGEEFETFCAYLLEKNKFTDIILTKGSGDRGIDILAHKNRLSYAIQCKRYSNSVGNKAVQEAFSGKTLYKADVAVVMTNSFFTKQAIEDAEKLSVQLWDRYKLTNLIEAGKVEIGNTSVEDK